MLSPEKRTRNALAEQIRTASREGVPVGAGSHRLGHPGPEITYRFCTYLRPDDEAAGGRR